MIALLNRILLNVVDAPSGWLSALFVTVSGALLYVQHQSSRVVVLRKLRGQNAVLRIAKDATDRENLSLRNRIDHLRTELNALDVLATERKERIDHMDKVIDAMRNQVAHMRTELDLEKKRSDELFGRVAKLLADQNRLDELLGNRDNITG